MKAIFGRSSSLNRRRPIRIDGGVEKGCAPQRRRVAPDGPGARFGHRQRLGRILYREAGRQQHAVDELAREPQHPGAHCGEVERDRSGRAERHPHAVQAEYLALIGACLTGPELAQARDELAHCDERPFEPRPGFDQERRIAGTEGEGEGGASGRGFGDRRHATSAFIVPGFDQEHRIAGTEGEGGARPGAASAIVVTETGDQRWGLIAVGTTVARAVSSANAVHETRDWR